MALEWSHTNAVAAAAAAADALQEIKKGGGGFLALESGVGSVCVGVGCEGNWLLSNCPRPQTVVVTSQLMTLMQINWPPVHKGVLRTSCSGSKQGQEKTVLMHNNNLGCVWSCVR